MRTTIRLPDDLLAAAKRRAAETHRSLTTVIEDALREALSRKPGSRRRSRARLPTFAGDGLLPGVHLEDSAELLDLMEADTAAR
ncbi:MAG TPA: ribbon-helix-helix protein, CopG family [Myxococcaceae bacterium]|nr:ribbon-helix-helix protein, CopG family [Myxococcaceae bacterium]